MVLTMVFAAHTAHSIMRLMTSMMLFEGVEDPLHGLRAELHAAGDLCDALDDLLAASGKWSAATSTRAGVGRLCPLCGLIVGDGHAAVVGVGVDLVLRALDQPLAEGEAGLGRLLPGRFDVGPGPA